MTEVKVSNMHPLSHVVCVQRQTSELKEKICTPDSGVSVRAHVCSLTIMFHSAAMPHKERGLKQMENELKINV